MNKCNVCGFLNRDDYNICQDCGTQTFPENNELWCSSCEMDMEFDEKINCMGCGKYLGSEENA